MSKLTELKKKLRDAPDTIRFEDIIEFIDERYDFTPTAFRNGDLTNAAGENNGSCKLLSFAQSQQLNPQDTLTCFGQYYREVLDDPDGDSHQNIRNFMRTAWDGVHFDAAALQARAAG